MPVYEIEHPKTGQKIRLEGEGVPTDSDIREAFASIKTSDGRTPSYDNRVTDRAEIERKRREFVQGTAELPTRVKDTVNQAFNPNVQIPAADGVGDFMGRVLPQSITQLGPKMVKGAYEGIKGQTDPFVRSLSSLQPQGLPGPQMERNAGQAVRGLAEAMTAPTGLMGVDRAKEAWLTDPAGSALAIAPSLKALKGGANAVPRPNMGAAGEAVASKLYDMTLKQGTTLRPGIRRQNVKTGLEGGYLPNSKGVDRLAVDVGKAEAKIAAGIESGAGTVRGTLDRAISNVESLREQAKKSATPADNMAKIDAELERLKLNPMQEGAQPVPSFKEYSKGKMGPYMKEEGGHGAAMQRLSREFKELKSKAGETRGDIPIGKMQEMKVEQGQAVKYQNKTGQAVDAFQATIDKARIRGLKEELEIQLFDVFPELKQTNQKLGQMYQLQDVLERAASRIENNQGIGIGLPIKGGAGAAIGGFVGGPAGAAVGGAVGTMIGIIEHPSVAPRLAVSLHKASRGKVTMKEARRTAEQRLATLKKQLIASQAANNAKQDKDR